jgi:heme exporter protein A
MDEPTVSLDGPSTELFQKMLTQHLENGGIAILATHIDLGIVGARTLDLTLFRARHSAKYPIDPSNFDEALI